MKKQTSSKVSKLAGKYMKFTPEDLHRLSVMSDDSEARFCADVRAMAASLVSQDETKGPNKK